MSWMSCKLSGTSAAFAIASKCITPFVDPPSTVIKRTAFSKDSRVSMSLGLMSFSNKFLMAFPIRVHSSCFSELTAGLEELYGKLIPNTSIAEAIVFAVYIPPHAPAPGIAFLMTALNSSGVISPAFF